MTQSDERRIQGVNRVPVSTLVEICGNDPGVPAFEAESLDISGRGMQVRTAYLPEDGAPLVCRFEDQGREIVVEGVVAWRRESARGGEFGIQFTALDSGSVEALKDLCGSGAETGESTAPDEADAESPQPVGAGARVRLHIDGLGAPMKARVRGGGGRAVQVGSNLEFLKVGRHLEVEDIQQGGKRSAIIDSVDVVVDPASQVPQLVVALRFDDAETTPEPSVVDSAPAGTRRATQPMPRASFDGGSASTDDPDDEMAEEPADVDDMMDDAAAFKTRLGGVAQGAGAIARTTGGVLARAGSSAAVGIGKLFKGASAKVGEMRDKRVAAAAPRRTTAAPPSGVLSTAGSRLRPQSSAHVSVEPPAPPMPAWKQPRAKKAAAAAGMIAMLVTVLAVATHKSSAPPGADAVAAAKPVAVSGDVTSVDEQGNPLAAAGSAAAPTGPLPGKPLANAPPVDSAQAAAGVTADVPLFGDKTMATKEPAPLGSVAPDPAAEAPPAAAAAPQTEEQKEMDAANAPPDEAFPDSTGSGDDKPGETNKKHKKPGDVEPWGRGNVKSPTIHRLRLDSPGAAIQGAVSATGFTVVIPGRKVMESAAAIAKRDKRIARVRTTNIGAGAQISFQFREGVPGYRVRLRKDFVEFLISAPTSGNAASTKDDGDKGKDEKKPHHHHHHKKGKSAHASGNAKPASKDGKK